MPGRDETISRIARLRGVPVAASLCGCLGVLPIPISAQTCEPTAAVLARVPPVPPPDLGPMPSEPLATAALGVGHLHPDVEAALAGPPGDNGWVQRVALPLSGTPDGEPHTWIVRGWVVRAEGAPEPIALRGMLETGYEEVSFVVLERMDGWLHVRYASAARDTEAAWVPECALDASPARLTFSTWSDWLLGDGISPLFVRDNLPLTLHAEPSEASAGLASVTEADVLVPHEIRGAWMRVTLAQPSGYCFPDVVSASREGWVRWLGEERGPRLWYFTRGC